MTVENASCLFCISAESALRKKPTLQKVDKAFNFLSTDNNTNNVNNANAPLTFAARVVHQQAMVSFNLLRSLSSPNSLR